MHHCLKITAVGSVSEAALSKKDSCPGLNPAISLFQVLHESSNLAESANSHWTVSVCKWMLRLDLILLDNNFFAFMYKDCAVGNEDSCSRACISRE